MARSSRRWGAVLAASVLCLVAGCGDDTKTVSDGNPLTEDQEASSDDWIISLYEGASQNGPGSFRGGEVAVPPEVVTAGLKDIESNYMAELVDMNGTTFDGNCFMEKDNDDETKYKQRVDCGPYIDNTGEVTWVLVPISVTFDKDKQPDGFDHLPQLTNLRGIVPESSAKFLDRLVRPDDKKPSLGS